MGAAPPPWGLGQEFQPNHTRNWGGNTPKSPCLSFPIALIPVLPKSGVSPRTPQTLSWGLDQPTGYTQTPRNRVKTPQNRVKPTQMAAVAARCWSPLNPPHPFFMVLGKKKPLFSIFFAAGYLQAPGSRPCGWGLILGGGQWERKRTQIPHGYHEGKEASDGKRSLKNL